MKALRVLLALAVSHIAYALSRAAERLLGERKPPQRTEPTAIKPTDWRPPTADEIDRCRGECAAHGLPCVKICRGPGKGCHRGWQEQGKCSDCYLVHWHDQRSSSEIRAAMERGDA